MRGPPNEADFMEWEIKPFGKKSSVSGNPFNDGDTVHCFLIQDRKGNLSRKDLLRDDLEQLPHGDRILGRWTRTFKSDPDVRQENLNHQKTLEELFFSFYEAKNAVGSEESDTLKQIVSLMLERKRILRRATTSSDRTSLRYLHVKSKAGFEVPNRNIDSNVVLRVQEQLNALIR